MLKIFILNNQLFIFKINIKKLILKKSNIKISRIIYNLKSILILKKINNFVNKIIVENN